MKSLLEKCYLGHGEPFVRIVDARCSECAQEYLWVAVHDVANVRLPAIVPAACFAGDLGQAECGTCGAQVLMATEAVS